MQCQGFSRLLQYCYVTLLWSSHAHKLVFFYPLLYSTCSCILQSGPGGLAVKNRHHVHASLLHSSCFRPLRSSSCARFPFITTWLKPLNVTLPCHSLFKSAMNSDESEIFNGIALVPLKALFSWIPNESQECSAACSDIFPVIEVMALRDCKWSSYLLRC